MATVQDAAIKARADYTNKAQLLAEDYPQLSQVLGARDAKAMSDYLVENPQLDKSMRTRIEDVLSSLRTAENSEAQAQQQAQQQAIQNAENLNEPGAGAGLALGGAAAAAQATKDLHPSTMEADRKYQKVLQDLKDKHEEDKKIKVDQWLKQQQADLDARIKDAKERKDWKATADLSLQRRNIKVTDQVLATLGYTKESELNFLYGSLDGTTPSLHDQSRKLFLEQEFDPKTGQYSRRAQRYLRQEQRVNPIRGLFPQTDPRVKQMKQQAEEHLRARITNTSIKDRNDILREERRKIYDAERARFAKISPAKANDPRYQQHLDKYISRQLSTSSAADSRRSFFYNLRSIFSPGFSTFSRNASGGAMTSFIGGINNIGNAFKRGGGLRPLRQARQLTNTLKKAKQLTQIGRFMLMIFGSWGIVLGVLLLLVFTYFFMGGGGGGMSPALMGSGSANKNCSQSFSNISDLTDAYSNNFTYDLDTTELSSDQEVSDASFVYQQICLLFNNDTFKSNFEQGFPPQSGNSLIKLISSSSDLLTDDEKNNIKKAGSSCGSFVYDYQNYNLGSVITDLVSNNLQTNHQMQITFFDLNKCPHSQVEEAYVIINRFAIIYTNNYFSDNVGGKQAKDDFRNLLKSNNQLLGTPNCKGSVPATIDDTLLYGCFSDMITQYFLAKG